MGKLAALLWAILAATAFGQVTDHEPLVIEPYKIGLIHSEVPAQTDTTQSIVAWKPSSPLLDYRVHGDEICVVAPPGQYTLTQEITTITVDWDAKKFALTQQTHATPITVRGTPLPDPDPPKPDPPPDPPIPDAGKRAIILIRESADATPEVARLLVGLRAGAAGKYLADKGHTLSILDDDAVTADGQPSPVVQAWRKQYDAIGLPCLIVASVTEAGTTVLQAVKLPANATTSTVLDIVKANGG